MSLAAYKFKVGPEGIDVPSPDGEHTWRWTDAVMVVIADTAADALELAVAESPRDATWLRAVTPERIDLGKPKFIALASLPPSVLEK